MYKDYFGLKEEPFSIAPDPQFLYMSEHHREALGHLVYGMKINGGFVLLTGEVGTGKTTVCRCLLEQIPEDSEVAFVFNPKLTVIELLETLCDELRIEYPPGNLSNKLFIDAINRFLIDAHSKGRKTVLIIDEAQSLFPSVLEQIRLLTNLETNKQKLLQVIMLGQPELKLMLERPELRQLAQRITARYHLDPLPRHEIKTYVDHRMTVAGVERRLFPPATINKIYKLSGGIPRVINLLCDRALLGAYVREQQTVSPKLLAEAAREVFGEREKQKKVSSPTGRLILLAVLITIGGAQLAANYWDEPPPLIPAPASERIAITAEDTAQPEWDRLEWDDPLPIDQSEPMAYQSLFELWRISYQRGQGSVFDQASRQGLQLGNKRGSFEQLRHLNRPVVLKLKNFLGQEFFVTLISLTDKTATLVIGKQHRTVPLSALAIQWFGEFFLLWQAPPGFQGNLKAGATGQMVQWLDQQMASLNGRGPSLEQNISLSGRLLEEVQRFQLSEGLVPDGVVGTYTLIHLNNKIGYQHPTLADGQEG